MTTDKTQQLQVPKLLKESLVDFALATGIQYFKSNSYGTGRRFCNLNLLDIHLTDQVKKFADSCFKEIFNVVVIEEPSFGNFLGVNNTGAYVHEHKDGKGPNNEWHVRLNFLIQKPLGGGMPVINGNTLSLNENDCWINLASQWYHSSTPVEGNRSRIVLSLGSFVDQSSVIRSLSL